MPFIFVVLFLILFFMSIYCKIKKNLNSIIYLKLING